MRPKASVDTRALDRAIVKAVAGIERGAVRGQRLAAASVADDWRSNAPVDTGEYKDSIESDDESAFATADHSRFVEFGTSTTVAQPAGTEAAERARRRMPDQVADEIKRELP